MFFMVVEFTAAKYNADAAEYIKQKETLTTHSPQTQSTNSFKHTS
jgi:hypothetical protein